MISHTKLMTHFFLWFQFLYYCLQPACAQDGMKGPWPTHQRDDGRNSSSNISVNKSPSSISQPLLIFYQKFISPTKGRHCSSTPSCSSFSREAIGSYGFVKGCLMTADRIHRCGHDTNQYTFIISNNSRKVYDPIERSALSHYHQRWNAIRQGVSELSLKKYEMINEQ